MANCDNGLILLFLTEIPRVISMQNTAPEPYYNDQTDVRPKSREGKLMVSFFSLFHLYKIFK